MLIIIIMIMTIIMALVMVTLTYFYAILIFLVPSSFCTLPLTVSSQPEISWISLQLEAQLPTRRLTKTPMMTMKMRLTKTGRRSRQNCLAVPLKGVSRIIIDIHPLKPIWNTEYASCSWKDKAFSTRPRLCMWRNYCMVLVNSL